MWDLSFDSIKRFLFDLLVTASVSMTVLKILAIEWKTLRRLLCGKHRQL
jgi:hypothetical protein